MLPRRSVAAVANGACSAPIELPGGEVVIAERVNAFGIGLWNVVPGEAR